MDALAARLVAAWGGRETEQNWERVEALLKEATAALDATPHDVLLAGIRRAAEVYCGALASERTRLVLTAMDTLQRTAVAMQGRFEPCQELFLAHVLKLCERMNRIVSERARTLLVALLVACPAPLRVVMARLAEGKGSANKVLRQSVVEASTAILEGAPREALSEHVEALARTVKDGLQDAAEPVRTSSRPLFVAFRRAFPAEASK